MMQRGRRYPALSRRVPRGMDLEREEMPHIEDPLQLHRNLNCVLRPGSVRRRRRCALIGQ